MEVLSEKSGNGLVVTPVGRLDSNTAAVFERELAGFVARGERRVILDFARLDYISSAGLRVVLMLVKQLKAEKGDVLLCGMKASIKEVFDISGFSKILQIYPTRDDAIAAE